MNKLRIGATGVSTRKEADLLDDHVGNMSNSICSLMNKMPKNASKIVVNKECVKDILRDHVKTEMTAINASIEEFK